jgi:cytidylate kinase
MLGVGGSAVLVITGAMAAGKSTVAQLLAERLPRAAHVRGDLFRRSIVSGRADLTPDRASEAREQLRLRYRLSAMVADEYAAAGFVAVVQDVMLGSALGEYVALVRARPLYVVVLAPRAEVLAARDGTRSKTGYGAWTSAELDRSLREETPRIGLWLDTSEQTPTQTVELILAKAADALVKP